MNVILSGCSGFEVHGLHRSADRLKLCVECVHCLEAGVPFLVAYYVESAFNH